MYDYHYGGGIFMSNLDYIISQRRSWRDFSEQELEQEKIEQVIDAGRMAPFAGLVQRSTDTFRHFFVIHRDSAAAEILKELVQEGRKAEVLRLKKEGLDQKYPDVAKMIEGMSMQPANDMFVSPYLIVIAERGGLPQREAVCLGYVLENMWLKATELGLGFKISSSVSDIYNSPKAKELFGLPQDEVFAFDACNIGYSSCPIPERTEHPKPVTSIKYFR